jgi:hypothetical protein
MNAPLLNALHCLRSQGDLVVSLCDEAIFSGVGGEHKSLRTLPDQLRLLMARIGEVLIALEQEGTGDERGDVTG